MQPGKQSSWLPGCLNLLAGTKHPEYYSLEIGKRCKFFKPVYSYLDKLLAVKTSYSQKKKQPKTKQNKSSVLDWCEQQPYGISTAYVKLNTTFGWVKAYCWSSLSKYISVLKNSYVVPEYRSCSEQKRP